MQAKATKLCDFCYYLSRKNWHDMDITIANILLRSLFLMKNYNLIEVNFLFLGHSSRLLLV